MSYQSEDRYERRMIAIENQIIDRAASGEDCEDDRQTCESCGKSCHGQHCCQACERHGTLLWLAGEMLRTILNERNADFIHPKLKEVATAWAKTYERAGGSLKDEV